MTNVRDPASLAKEKYLSTVCDVVEIFSKDLKETTLRDLVFLAKENNLSTVYDDDEILEETNMRPPESLV